MIIIRLNPSCASYTTIQRRVLYGGRKGRAAVRRLRREMRFLTKLAHSIAGDLDVVVGVRSHDPKRDTYDGIPRIELEDTEHRA